jgi:membrane protease subunit HflC
MPTLDKTYIWVDTFARWRIKDPLTFFETVNNEMAGQKKLDDIIDPATWNLITSHHLIEAVRNSDRKMDIKEAGVDEVYKALILKPIEMGRERIATAIMEQANPKLTQFGIELVDVRIKRINYVEEVRKAVLVHTRQLRRLREKPMLRQHASMRKPITKIPNSTLLLIP